MTNYYDFQHCCHSILLGPSEGYDQLQPIIRAKQVSKYMSAILYANQICIILVDIASEKRGKINKKKNADRKPYPALNMHSDV